MIDVEALVAIQKERQRIRRERQAAAARERRKRTKEENESWLKSQADEPVKDSLNIADIRQANPDRTARLIDDILCGRRRLIYTSERGDANG